MSTRVAISREGPRCRVFIFATLDDDTLLRFRDTLAERLWRAAQGA